MEITEVRVKLVSGKNDKLRAFCSITIDNDFVIRDLKIIDGVKGPFVAMPSRKLMERCEKCGSKNHYRAKYCNDCGSRLSRPASRRPEGGRPDSSRFEADSGGEEEGRSRLHTEIAHPINSRCREMIQQRVLSEYRREREEQGETAASRADERDEFDDYFQESREATRPEKSAGGKPAFDDPSLDRSRSKSSPPEGPESVRGREPKKEPGTPEGGRRHPLEDAASSADDEPEDNFGAGIFP